MTIGPTIIVLGVIDLLMESQHREQCHQICIKVLGDVCSDFLLGAGCVCADYYLVKSGSQGFGLLGIAIAFGFVVVCYCVFIRLCIRRSYQSRGYNLHGCFKQDGCENGIPVYCFTIRRGYIGRDFVENAFSRGNGNKSGDMHPWFRSYNITSYHYGSSNNISSGFCSICNSD